MTDLVPVQRPDNPVNPRNDQGETEMTRAQYELINAVLAAPGGIVVDNRGTAWVLGAKCTGTFEAAERRGYVRLADEPDAAGQRAVVVTDEGRAAARRWAEVTL